MPYNVRRKVGVHMWLYRRPMRRRVAQLLAAGTGEFVPVSHDLEEGTVTLYLHSELSDNRSSYSLVLSRSEAANLARILARYARSLDAAE